MDKTFVIVVCAIAIVGFSVSAYIFGQTNIVSEFSSITDNIAAKKAEIINEVNRCINQNKVAGGSVTLNSFENNFLTNIINQVENTNDSATLDKISEQIYTITACKQN
tara:strand:- start:846 stop:1169 length:324 start_codon:yes stop_codon:yes gene_type:complete